LPPEQTPPGAGHRPHGNDRIEVADGAVWLVCAAPKGWSPRRGQSHTSSEYPGTAVRWDTELFEVVDAISHPDGSVRYRLEPWPDRHAVRSIRTYDAASEAGRPLVAASHKKNILRRRLAILFSPLLGHLPGRVQEQMESEFGAPAIAMTVVSALPLFALGAVSSLFSVVTMVGGAFSSGATGLPDNESSIPHLLPFPIAVYLTFESGLRLGAAFLQNRPIGSLPGTLLYSIYRAFRGGPGVAALSSRGSPASPERALSDRFRMIEPLLALLPPEEQEVLERRFGMEVLRWGRVTAVLLLIIGVANVFTSLVRFAGGIAGFGDWLWLLAGVGLSFEQIGRLRRISSGQPAGSFLGALVRPLARKLLKEPGST
jgi:hypothetical protein